MKTRNLILFSAGGIVCILGFYFIFNLNTSKNVLTNNQEKIVLEEQNIHPAIEYTRKIKADPKTGLIDPAAVSRAVDQANALGNTRGELGLEWESRGPDNIGGRTRAFVVDKDDQNTLYTGSVAGGIYKSTNGGKSWKKKKYDAEAGGLIISCMTQAADGALYVGTGEDFFTFSNGSGNSGTIGGGMYKSTDRGETWRFLESTDPTKSGKSGWYNVQAVASHPSDPMKIYAATDRGLRMSVDSGATWTLYPGSRTSGYIDIKISPDGNTIFAVRPGNVERSINGGDLSLSINISGSYRIAIDISPSNPDYIYACAIRTDGYLEGIYRSTDNGENWEKIVDGGTQLGIFNGQGIYNLCIGIDPYNPKRFFVGGVVFYCYNDGFFYKAASLGKFMDTKGEIRNPYYIHADKHLIVFDTKSIPYKMWVVTDGGIFMSDDASNNKYPTYSSQNVNYRTAQLYAIAASTEGSIIGGTQDNGSFRIEIDGHTGNSAYDILGGDGFYCEISRYYPDVFFYESQYARLARSNNQGKGGDSMLKKKDFPYNTESSINFNTPFRLWEDEIDTFYIDTLITPYDTSYDTVTKFVISKFFLAIYLNGGLGGLWMTEEALDFGADKINWTQISDPMAVDILCLEYSPDGDAVFMGASNGSLYRVSGIKSKNYKTEGLKTWSKAVTGIGVDPNDGNNIIITLGNYSSGDHVFMSTNALDSSHLFTYQSIHGDLPDMPVYDAEIHSEDANQIIIVTELGVWATNKPDGGSTEWTEENYGMDRVPTYMIRQVKEKPWHDGSIFYVGTHGMGIFSTSSLGTNLGIRPITKNAFEPSISVYPNPCTDKLYVKFDLDKSIALKAQIFDIQGRVVKNLYIKRTYVGGNKVEINVDNLISGTYFIRMTGKDVNLTSRFIVSK